MSDIFRTLTGGGAAGARFDKRRFAEDVSIFDPKSAASSSSSSSSSAVQTAALPAELDFFGAGSGKNPKKAKNVKKAEEVEGTKKGKGKAVEGESEEESSSDEEEEDDENGVPVPVTRKTLGPFLKANKVKLSGTDAPLPLTSWSELSTRWGAPDWLVEAPVKAGFERPTAIQCTAGAVLLDDRDLLAGAPTGSGKTLAYLLPLLHHLGSPKKAGFRALIVAPTRELATQIQNHLKALAGPKGVRICVLSKSSEGNVKDAAYIKKFDVLITTPLRLVHALEQEELDLSGVRHLILDEADRLLEDGFLEQTDAILAACSHPGLRKALFSATLPAGVEEMAKTFQLDAVRVIVGTKDGATESIEQSLTYVGSEEGKLHAMRSLIHEGGLKPPALIFVQSIARARELFHELVYDGLHVDVIHGERPRAQRDAVVDAFKRGDVWVLICTELLARGIDFKGVRLVINYDFPQSVQSYVHRIGRTGRAGRDGRAITFFTKDDAPYLKTVANIMKASGAEVPEWMLKLKKANQNARNALKRKAPERVDIRTAAGSTAGRKQANKRRDMVAGSKRRKAGESGKAAKVGGSAAAGGAEEA